LGNKGVTTRRIKKKIMYTVSIIELRGSYSTFMIQQSNIWEQFSENIHCIPF